MNCENPCVQCAPSIGGGRGPIDPANPFVNLSSEGPDFDAFIGRYYTNPGDPPPLGGVFFALGCLGWCISAISQEDANICAYNQQVLCTSGDWPQPPVLPPGQPLNPLNPGNPGTPQTIYYNSAQSCSFACPDGSEFIFTVPAGTFSALFNQATVDALAHSYACNQAAIQKLCISDLAPQITCVDALYEGSVFATTINVPVTFTTSTPMPPGLFLSQNPGAAFISGVPTLAGDYVIALVATDVKGHVMQKNLPLTVFGFTTASTLATATEGIVYAVALETAGTTADNVTFSIVSGALPIGLSLNPLTGVISGNPDASNDPGNYYIVVRASSSDIACQKEFLIPLEEASVCPDWVHLLWNAPAYFTQDGGFASFTPDSIEGAVFNGDVQVNGVFESQAAANNIGEISYNGPGCQCNLHVDLTNPLPGAAGFNSAIIRITDETVFAILLDLDVINDASGPYDYLFVLPDTGGIPHTIRVTVQLARYYLAGATNTIVQGTLSNV